MRRLSVYLVVPVLALLAFAPASFAANKNQQQVTATCDNGKTYTVTVNERSNINGVVKAAGLGPVKVISITAFAPGTSVVLFTDQSRFPKSANLTCHGTTTEVDPDTGEPFTFDFVVEVYARGA
jgi:hypothetical protein